MDFGLAGGPGLAHGRIRNVDIWAFSTGVYLGAAFDTTMIAQRPKANEKFYGRPLTVETILSGNVSRPVVAKPLYDALKAIEAT